MKIKLVFDDWQKEGKSIYSTEKGVELSMCNFHAGTTFDGEINLNKEQEEELKAALRKNYQPIFWMTE
jgi:hypothetical protein